MKLLRHTVFNLIGLGAPLLVAVGTIPVLIHELGPSRFGLLTLIWAVVSYFGLFDLGLGRALTQQLAGVFANKEHKKVGPLVGTATVLMAILGVLAGVLMAAAASWGVGLVHDVPDRQEVVNAVYAMALAMPFIVLTSGFRGILEARHAFGIVNLIRLPMGLFTFLGPLVVVLYGGGPRLDYIAWVLVAGRVIACAVHAYYAWRILPKESSVLVWQADLLKPLCISGGWLTVSNIISPFMGYVDRFVIGAIVSASAVAYYATPQELVTKLWIVPGALTAVLFPAFAIQMARRDEQTWALFKKAVHWLFLALLPVTVALTLFAHELLTLWINPGFADNSAILLQVFGIGILINCLAHVPFTLIQSAGAARLTALAHLVELPFFLAALWWLTSIHGTLGAAIAWLLRMVLDTLLMFVLCSPLLGRSAKSLLNLKVVSLALIAAGGFAGVLIQPMAVRIVWVILVAGASVLTLLSSLKILRDHSA
jgi:O-antigen/teichoic acid export membrane protein